MEPWRNKIIEHDEVNPYALVAHYKNFRTHSKDQKDALVGAIEDISIIRSVTVNKRTGRILDGHLRVRLALEKGQKTIPVEYVDLTEEEELEALATIDPLAALAEADKPKLDALLQQVKSNQPAVTQLLADLARKNGIAARAGQVIEPLPAPAPSTNGHLANGANGQRPDQGQSRGRGEDAR